MASPKSKAADNARMRERRRAAGLTSIEAVLHRDDVASLDVLKAQLGATSRSEVLRALIAKADRADLSPADVARLSEPSAA
ncbi:ribbon-helix-helix protein, CopG family [Aureimonas ureilytica]|nr:ribbon-helix-helix protein, CopG family [Aureimonas ureilytica]